MVNWIVQVMKTFKFSGRSFFLTTSLIDRYYKASAKCLTEDDVHLIGVTSIFIISKYEELQSLPMGILIDRVAFGAFTPKDIMAKEIHIL